MSAKRLTMLMRNTNRNALDFCCMLSLREWNHVPGCSVRLTIGAHLVVHEPRRKAASAHLVFGWRCAFALGVKDPERTIRFEVRGEIVDRIQIARLVHLVEDDI